MKFNRRIEQLIENVYYPYLKTKGIWSYLVVLVFVIANSLVTVGIIKYLSNRQNQKNIDRIANDYVQNASNRFITDLYNFKKLENDNNNSIDQKTLFFEEMLDEYLAKNISTVAKITIVDRDGLIIASDSFPSDSKSTVSSQDILLNLQQKLGSLSSLEQSEKLNLKIKQQNILTQVIPWENKNLGQKYIIIITVPKSTLLVNSVAKQDNSIPEYLWYLLPTIISGLLASMGITFLIQKLNKSKENKIDLAQQAIPEAEEEQQIVLSNNQGDLEISQAYMLLVNMSHELRSPLNAILGFAQIMEQESSLAQVDKDNIAMINRSGERMLAIINDVIDLAKIETNTLTLEQNNIDFYSWLDSIEQSFKFQARKQGWEFTLTKQDNLPEYICIDEHRLSQIIKNLTNYCLKSNSSANISLTVSSNCLIQQTETTNTDSSNKRYSIDFEFKNPDFSATATELAALFDPIARVRQGREHPDSSSLNLPISRKLSQLMGGDIVIKDKSITGSGVAFNLEIQTESVDAEKSQIKSTIQRIIGLELDQAEYRILVVDDSKTNRKIMSQILESVGFQVQEAVNGSEAIDIWLRWQPHMIWMDLRMPVMNGCEATERIKSSSPNIHIPIVALSASTLEEEKAQFKAAGCDDYVVKPFSDQIIFDKIAQHLGIPYIYESKVPPSSSIFKLTVDALNVMPSHWLNRFEQGAVELNRDSLTQLLQEIPPEHRDLENALKKRIDDFDFDQILNLIQNSRSN